jgi:hypothetical protein
MAVRVMYRDNYSTVACGHYIATADIYSHLIATGPSAYSVDNYFRNLFIKTSRVGWESTDEARNMISYVTVVSTEKCNLVTEVINGKQSIINADSKRNKLISHSFLRSYTIMRHSLVNHM